VIHMGSLNLDKLAEKTNWTNNIQYLKNNTIIEYDVQSAGLNILRDLNLISPDKYESFLAMEKLDRNVAIGKMLQHNPQMNEQLDRGFIMLRQQFFKQNNLDITDILSIKKDAIFLINRENINGDISEHIHFRQKHTYTAYIQIQHKEHFLTPFTHDLEVKGYSDLVKQYHSSRLLSDLRQCLIYDSLGQKDQIFKLLVELKYKLTTYNLDLDYYRSINNGHFEFKLGNDRIYVDDIKEDLLHYVNLDYNLDFILSMIKVFDI